MNTKYYLTKVFDCDHCQGTGILIKRNTSCPCPNCDGEGQIEIQIQLEQALKELQIIHFDIPTNTPTTKKPILG